ncbi:MAG: DUF790 family protein [Anaerolineales bacterium]|nr:DUF790 family protein [Anaerolineales bacterium]
MLKAELIRPRLIVQGDQVKPRQLAADYHWLQVAGELIALLQQHVGQTRGALEDALRDYEGDSLDYPIIRGLAAVLSNQAVFANDPAVDPAELRAALFAQGPVTARTDLFQVKERAQVVRETAVSYQLAPAQIETALFADLLEEQILQDTGAAITPGDLIARYNLEVARGLLYWARQVNLHIGANYRDLFRYIKLMQLMYTISPAQNGYDITLHGPISPFVQSTIRYGLQFARFMPALLLCQSWHMDAQVRPPSARDFLHYRLDDQTDLQGYFKASAEFASKLEANFAAEFADKYNQANRIWEMAYEDEILLLDDTIMIPDFSFTHKKDGRRALLEIVGFWHPDYLRRKLEKIAQAGRRDLIVLVYESANVSQAAFQAASAGEVLTFKRKPVLKEVLAAVERCAC